MAEAAKGEMTIGQLAERTGMTVRNIRAHQTRGLLPPPTVRGRTGYYTEDHVARIALTREMQADGLNLEAIRRGLDSSGGAAAASSDRPRALRVPSEHDPPAFLDAGDPLKASGIKPDGPLLTRAKKLGIVRALPDGRIEVISPRLQHVPPDLSELGIGVEGAVSTAE